MRSSIFQLAENICYNKLPQKLEKRYPLFLILCASPCYNYLYKFYYSKLQLLIKGLSRGRFHKPIHALRQALTLCAELLGLKKVSQKLGAEGKSLA